MIVIIPAAGEGKRLADIQPGVPKALKKVAGKPMICHTLEKVNFYFPRPKKLLIVISPAEAAAFRSVLVHDILYWGLEFVEQPQPYGTGDAVWRALESVSGFSSESLLVMYPDLITHRRLSDFILHGNAIMTKPRDGSGSCVYRCPSDPNRVISVSENPRMGMGNTDEKLGDWYYVENAMHLYIALKCLAGLSWAGYQGVYVPKTTRLEFSLTQGIDALMRCGIPFRGVRVDDYCSLGNPEGFNKAEGWLKGAKG